MIVLTTLTAKYRFGSRLLVLLAVLALGVSNAAAIPLADYHKNLEHVIADVKSLLARETNESDEVYEDRFAATIDAIRSELPRNQQVELGKETLNTDNGWLHTALDDLKASNIEDRSSKLTSILDWLRAVDERVKELETAEKVDDNKAAAREKLESILARPEYASTAQGPNALTRLILDFIRWFQGLFPERPQVEPGSAYVISFIAQILVVAVALSIILYVLWLVFTRFVRPRRRQVREKKGARIVLGERLEPEDTASDLLAEAEALARRGDLRAAIRKGYIALLVELGDRKLISLAQYKTNRDYLKSVNNLPQLHSRLKTLTESFERHWYGFAQATPNDWQDFRAGYREALQTGN